MKYFNNFKKIHYFEVKSKLLIVNCQQGMAALLTIVIIAAASLIMAYTASILSLGELEMGYNSQKASETLSLADGCLEESLRRLKLDAGYGGGTLNLGEGSCIITVAPGDGDVTINVTGSLGKYNKKIKVVAGVVGSDITIESWEELSL